MQFSTAQARALRSAIQSGGEVVLFPGDATSGAEAMTHRDTMAITTFRALVRMEALVEIRREHKFRNPIIVSQIVYHLSPEARRAIESMESREETNGKSSA